MYFVEKRGVYSHGIFWIGKCLEEAKKMANHFANKDGDNYHTYDVLEFEEQTCSRSDASHTEIYSTSKDKQMFQEK